MLRIERNNLNFPYSMCNTAVSINANSKDLGIYVSDSLSFSYHISVISCKTHYRRRQLLQSFARKDIEFQKFLFCTYVRPINEHNSVKWSENLVQDINKIERKFIKHLPSLYNVHVLREFISKFDSFMTVDEFYN